MTSARANCTASTGWHLTLAGGLVESRQQPVRRTGCDDVAVYEWRFAVGSGWRTSAEVFGQAPLPDDSVGGLQARQFAAVAFDLDAFTIECRRATWPLLPCGSGWPLQAEMRLLTSSADEIPS